MSPAKQSEAEADIRGELRKLHDRLHLLETTPPNAGKLILTTTQMISVGVFVATMALGWSQLMNRLDVQAEIVRGQSQIQQERSETLSKAIDEIKKAQTLQALELSAFKDAITNKTGVRR